MQLTIASCTSTGRRWMLSMYASLRSQWTEQPSINSSAVCTSVDAATSTHCR